MKKAYSTLLLCNVTVLIVIIWYTVSKATQRMSLNCWKTTNLNMSHQSSLMLILTPTNAICSMGYRNKKTECNVWISCMAVVKAKLQLFHRDQTFHRQIGTTLLIYQHSNMNLGRLWFKSFKERIDFEHCWFNKLLLNPTAIYDLLYSQESRIWKLVA